MFLISLYIKYRHLVQVQLIQFYLAFRYVPKTPRNDPNCSKNNPRGFIFRTNAMSTACDLRIRKKWCSLSSDTSTKFRFACATVLKTRPWKVVIIAEKMGGWAPAMPNYAKIHGFSFLAPLCTSTPSKTHTNSCSLSSNMVIFRVNSKQASKLDPCVEQPSETRARALGMHTTHCHWCSLCSPQSEYSMFSPNDPKLHPNSLPKRSLSKIYLPHHTTHITQDTSHKTRVT